MLDYGLELETERREKLSRLAAVSKNEWKRQDLSFLKDGIQAEWRQVGVDLKRAYGSVFPFRAPEKVETENRGVKFYPSYAKGGLSNVWGALMLPYMQKDIEDWPVRAQELSPSYEAVLSFMKSFSAKKDDLEALFPLHTPVPDSLRPSRQISELFSDLERYKMELKKKGFVFGSSRVAVKGSECVYCGLCVYGCPYGLIYNSSSTLKILMSSSNFHYQGGVCVKKLIEKDGHVEIIAEAGGEETSFQAKRVYLAAGVLSSARILMESLSIEEGITIQDSQFFSFPIIRQKATPGAMTEETYTLAQIFIELLDPEISKHTAQLQVYPYNELYTQAISRFFGPAHILFKPFEKQALERMMVMFGYLHSKDSSAMNLRLEKHNGASKLVVESRLNPAAKMAIKKIVRKIQKNAGPFGIFPFFPSVNIAPPGTSFHAGGSFPMSASPQDFQSDTLGRPMGLKRIHVVDASVFPSVPSTTITFTVMANAYRIGNLHGDTD